MTSQEKQQYWSQLFEQQAQSGLTITDFCKANKINISTYYNWRQKLTDIPSSPRIHPVVVQGSCKYPVYKTDIT
ncbi:IS66 family insertion sequence element accessory protein TnpA [Thorsellia kenyensis]|uniref:Transposase n=1 Tax=Thorsellia kenyensis TaxID=1549888 RepID=A0ABV6CCG2_9GAMM